MEGWSRPRILPIIFFCRSGQIQEFFLTFLTLAFYDIICEFLRDECVVLHLRIRCF